jgi:chemotaxis protein CheD
MAADLYFLEPGHIFLSRGIGFITSILGSCVAVALWDKQQHCGIMNHFIYPESAKPWDSNPVYGNIAIQTIIKKMQAIGCKRENLVAQIFGGSYPPGARGRDVGKENVELARKLLRHKKIPIISEDVRGQVGRKVFFNGLSGQAAILKVHHLRQSDWAPEVW